MSGSGTSFPSFDQQQAAFSWASDQVVSVSGAVTNAGVLRLQLGRRHTIAGTSDVIGDRDEYWRVWIADGAANANQPLVFKLLKIGDATPNVAAMTPGTSPAALIVKSSALEIAIRVTAQRPDLAVWWGKSGGTTTIYCNRYAPYNFQPGA